MGLLGVNTLDAIINGFLAPFGCSAFLGTDFGYYISDNSIEYALVIADSSSADFMASVEAHQPSVSADPFLWSLLHEIGHHETLLDVPDDEYEKAMLMKERGEYYTAPDEVAATRWAVEYAETHVEELQDFWRILQPAIMNFYKINKVEDDEV